MTLKEKFEDAKKNLELVKTAVESGEKSADDLASAIDEVKGIQSSMEAVAAAELLKKSLAPVKEAPAEKGARANTIGEQVAQDIQNVNVKQRHLDMQIKVAAPMVIPSSVVPAITDYDRNIVPGFRRQFTIKDLFGSERISGSGLKFFVESSTVEGSISATTEAQQKPFMSFGDPTAVYKELEKIPVHTKMSTEMISDAPFVADYINGRLMYEHQLAVENHLVSVLSDTSGIGTASLLTPDGIFKAMMTVQQNSGFAADAIVINPTDYQNIRLRKDSNGQYYGGGFIYGQYGNGAVAEQPAIWGLPTIITPAVAIGTCFVGAFKLGASVLHGADGIVTRVAYENEDDFIKNLVTVLIEERLALAVRRPSAFVKITGQSTSTAA